MRHFDPDTCDLCGSGDHEALIEVPTGRSMRSDRGVVAASLLKRACRRCGLVRSGCAHQGGSVEEYYAEQYTLGLQPEHFFYGPDGPVARSAVFCDWLLRGGGPAVWAAAARVLEVGAGSGNLLAEVARRCPGKTIEGIEPSRAAAARARERGLAVHDTPLEAAEGATYDVAYSIAVLEHVPSPTEFLQAVRRRLRPGGWLLLSQPTQDVPSYDVFFADHLHHFGTEHLRQYARKCGFLEEAAEVGHPLMPNFSLEVWRATEPPVEFSWQGPVARTTCGTTAARILGDMARLDALLARLSQERRRVAVFGLNEVYWLARCYSGLGDYPMACGLDDSPERPEYAKLPFPVMRPEECLPLGVQDVVLAMNTIYYQVAGERLRRLGLVAHPVLS